MDTPKRKREEDQGETKIKAADHPDSPQEDDAKPIGGNDESTEDLVPGLVAHQDENLQGLPVDSMGSAPTDDQKNTLTSATNGDTIMGFGKYSHLTYREVTELHKDYADWALRVTSPNGYLSRYVDWLYSREGRQIREGNQIFSFGQYQGKTFREIATKDPFYHVRYKHMQPGPNPTLDWYIRYFRDVKANNTQPTDSDMGSETFDFGQHFGQTWRQVAQMDPTYHIRFKRKRPAPHGVMDRYAKWFREHAAGT